MFYNEEHWHSLLDGKRILIAGYGREGRSSETFFRDYLPEVQFDVVDGNDNILAVAPDYDLILKSPGIPTMIFDGVCDSDKISSQTDLFLRVYGLQMVAVSGTKGKSTTTELIYSILSQHAPVGHNKEYTTVVKAGNMGIPLFDIIPQMDEHTLVVAELSCHQLENIHVAPHVSVLLNLFEEHLDHYRSYEDYKLAKLNLALKQKEGDRFFYCKDNDELCTLVDRYTLDIKSQVEPYSLDNAFVCELSPSLLGDHNRSNITVAADVAHSVFGIDKEDIASTVKSYKGLNYRMQFVGTYDGIDFYDDSISTIPAASMAAVKALQRVDTLILGGFDRGIDYADFARFLVDSDVSNLVFVGNAGQRMFQLYRNLLHESEDKRNVLIENDYGRIVPWCYQHTTQGRICLLSPAASSYDSFKNFEYRGRCFDTLVRSIALRHDLHRHAALSGREEYSHDKIVSELNVCNPTEVHTNVGGYGVVAFWGDKSKPCIAFRADIDALPISEKSGSAYCSNTAGVSHKCGHDGHTATLLHFAKMVAIQGLRQVLLVFQPEEETGLGSQKVIDSGVLAQYDIAYIFGMHNLPGFELGRMVLIRNTFAAASSGIIYHLQGRQTHASTPEMGVNPGLAVAQIINDFQHLNTGQDVSPGDFRQSTLICIRLGDEAFGTSAGNADVMFTLRAYTNNGMKELMAKADAIVDNACRLHSSERGAIAVTKEIREPFFATENDTTTVDAMIAMSDKEGIDYEVKELPFRWSEDFANYLMHYRGALFGIGAGTEHAELHHPDYDFPDEIIHSTALLYCKILRNFAKV